MACVIQHSVFSASLTQDCHLAMTLDVIAFSLKVSLVPLLGNIFLCSPLFCHLSAKYHKNMRTQSHSVICCYVGDVFGELMTYHLCMPFLCGLGFVCSNLR